MNEIRDRVIKQLIEIQTSNFSVDLRRRKGFTEAYIKRANQILSIPEIAIVDREAKLPNYIGAAIAGTLKDWVKEIKND